MRTGESRGPAERGRKVGVARVLSKAGFCSRSEGVALVGAGRVAVNGRVVRDAEHPVDSVRDVVTVDGKALPIAARVYLALNKPRGLVTTVRDEKGRDTVYRCFDGADLPWIAPVGRLDRASEGLLLFTNDSEWAARISDPSDGPDKTYHVQVDTIPDATVLAAVVRGVRDGEDTLAARRAELLRRGEKNAWLEIVLDEGRNRQIRRLLDAFEIQVLRLVRVGIGPLQLGPLPKGGWRFLGADEVAALSPSARPVRVRP
jgi:23S rRNA pseudouridine2605 synthase